MSAKVCPQCGRQYEGEQRFCSLDGSTLIPVGSGERLIGHTLADRYEIKKKLGEGGMGEVYLAEHVKMRRKVAIKVMRGALAKESAAVGRFYREAENASQISHPNVAAVYDFGDTKDGLVYLAMEYVDGEALTAVLERVGALNHARAADIVSQTADALAAAHALGILHRDLKPDNIMLGKTRAKTDLVKLLDFGISRMIGRETQNLTSTGLIVGTPEYMSPEQLSGDQLDARADVYALGLIAFRMLTGEGAFGAGSGQDVLLARMTRPPRRLRDVRPDVPWPDALQETLDKALATDPADRYAEAEAFAADFFVATTQLPASPESEAYRVALAQRSATPTRGVGMLEPTPPTPMAAIGSTPPVGIPAVPDRPVPPTATPPDDRPRTPISIVIEDPRFSEASAEYRVPDELPSVSGVQPSPVAPAPKEVTAPRPLSAIMEAAETARAATAAEAIDSQGVETATLSSPSGETTPFSVDSTPTVEISPPRRRIPLIAGGVVGLLALILLVSKLSQSGANGAATTPTSAADTSRVDSAALPNVNRADTSSIVAPGAGADRSAATLSLDVVRKNSENGVFRVIGSEGQGAGFLADKQGLVLTSASIVGANDSTATILVDGWKRLTARVLTRNANRGLAALRVSMKACDDCTALPLATDSSGLVPNDSVIAIGAPSLASPTRVSRGAVTARDSISGRLTTSLKVSGSLVGGPVLSTRGLVVGVARTGAQLTTIAGSAAFLTDASNALGRVALTPAMDSALLSWSSYAVDEGVLAQARQRKMEEIAPFRMDMGDFTVLVMTPQVIAWRQNAATQARSGNPFDLSSAAPCHASDRVCDPIEAWPAWGDYVSERRNVVIVQVAPKAATPPNVGTTGVAQEFRLGDLYSMELRRNGVALPVIESARLFAVANRQAYLNVGKQPFHTGVYVYHAEDFARGQRYELTAYDEANPQRPTTRVLPASLIDAILADLSRTRSR